MTITNILVSISSVLLVVSILPYLIGVIKGKTKPRVVSWIIWSILTAIACAAALVEKQYPTAIMLLFSSACTSIVVLFGWKLGDKKIERIDVVCFISALVGIVLWRIFNSPAIATLAMVAIDLIGGIPTLLHAWKKPHEEAWITFFLSFFGALCTLITVSDWQITAFAFPLYLVVVNLTFTLVIVLRGIVLSKKLL